MTQRKNASNTRGRPFQRGNPGRPRGARHKTTVAIEALLEGQYETLTQRAISKALEGDVTALKLCLDRLAPPRRDAPIKIELPQVAGAAETLAASAAVITALSKGEISPAEAGAVMAILSAHHRFVETLELEERLKALEQRAAEGGR
jgi:hypothetical protein